jgi:hypothetical protein
LSAEEQAALKESRMAAADDGSTEWFEQAMAEHGGADAFLEALQ